MKLVSLLAVVGLIAQSSAGLAAIPVQFSCSGENIELQGVGTEEADPATGKITFDIQLNIDTKLSTGDIVIRDLKYRGTKNVFGSLRQYPIMFAASNHADKIQGSFDSVSIAANNKPGQSGATFFDKDMNEENREFICQGIQ